MTISAPAALQAQTLTQALADAYNTNPQLLAQRALLRATDEQVPQALANWRPTVNFTGQVGIATTSEQLPPGPTSVNPTTGEVTRSTTDRRHVQTRPDSLTVTAAQPIYTGGRTAAQTSQAINLVESARAQTLAVET
ncbi:MAG TPA: TolC family protein, partial [Stellaceae bacterium]|nr:TolC family protein [Stellaceae bacterium]